MPKLKAKSYWSARRHVLSLVNAHMNEIEDEVNGCIMTEDCVSDEQFHATSDSVEFVNQSG